MSLSPPRSRNTAMASSRLPYLQYVHVDERCADPGVESDPAAAVRHE
jgi:hypothetical protein